MEKDNYLLKEKESWEIMAEDKAYITLPTFEDSEFLKLLYENDMLSPDYDVLDIGCGAGVYSIAMKDKIHSALGLDFSDNMLKNAERLIEENHADNVKLMKTSWQALDLDRENMRGKFDLVFSHTTPAISDSEALFKMIAASKKYCAVSLFARVNQPVMKEIKRLLNIRPEDEKDEARIDRIEKSVTMIFDTLYTNGYYPSVHYEDSPYCFRQRIETAIDYYTKDAEKIRPLTDIEKDMVEGYLYSIQKDGFVTEDMHPCIVTYLWDVRRKNRFSK